MMLTGIRTRFVPQITSRRVTPTIPHLARAIGLLYLYQGLVVIVRVSYGYIRVYPRVGSGQDPTRPRRPDRGYTRSRSLPVRLLLSLWPMALARCGIVGVTRPNVI